MNLRVQQVQVLLPYACYATVTVPELGISLTFFATAMPAQSDLISKKALPEVSKTFYKFNNAWSLSFITDAVQPTICYLKCDAWVRKYSSVILH